MYSRHLWKQRNQEQEQESHKKVDQHRSWGRLLQFKAWFKYLQALVIFRVLNHSIINMVNLRIVLHIFHYWIVLLLLARWGTWEILGDGSEVAVITLWRSSWLEVVADPEEPGGFQLVLTLLYFTTLSSSPQLWLHWPSAAPGQLPDAWLQTHEVRAPTDAPSSLLIVPLQGLCVLGFSH